MNLEQARDCVEKTSATGFDDARFLYFIRNPVNHLDESSSAVRFWGAEGITAKNAKNSKRIEPQRHEGTKERRLGSELTGEFW